MDRGPCCPPALIRRRGPWLKKVRNNRMAQQHKVAVTQSQLKTCACYLAGERRGCTDAVRRSSIKCPGPAVACNFPRLGQHQQQRQGPGIPPFVLLHQPSQLRCPIEKGKSTTSERGIAAVLRRAARSAKFARRSALIIDVLQPRYLPKVTH